MAREAYSLYVERAIRALFHHLAAGRTRIGVDIGGTFTDLVWVDDATGAVRVGKLLTTPKEPAQAVEQGVVALLHDAGRAPASCAPSSTAPRSPPTRSSSARARAPGLLTTAGFRDALEIGREGRYDMYDLFIDPPAPLVPRHLRLEVTRAGPGRRQRAHAARRASARAAIRGAAHRRRRGDRRVSAPRLPQSRPRARAGRPRARAGAGAARVVFVGGRARDPRVRAHVHHDGQRLRHAAHGPLPRRPRAEAPRIGDPPASFYIMLSSGGIATPETVKRVPDPARRVRPRGRRAGRRADGARPARTGMLSFDMGGTTAKACVIDRRRAARGAGVRGGASRPVQEGLRAADPRARDRDDRDRRRRRLHRADRPHGTPQGGAGERWGRSRARLLRPRRRASPPSPTPISCWATSIPASSSAAGCGSTCDGRAARHRGARGAAARAVAHRRRLGHPPRRQREHGGAPRASTASSAARTCAPIRSSPSAAPAPCTPGRWDASSGCRACSCPSAPGAMSAYGLLAAPLAFDFVRTAPQRLDGADWSQVNRLFAEMEAEGRAILRRAGVGRRRRCACGAPPRCATCGQGHEVECELPAGVLAAGEPRAHHSGFEDGLPHALQPHAARRGHRGAELARRRDGPAPRSHAWRRRAAPRRAPATRSRRRDRHTSPKRAATSRPRSTIATASRPGTSLAGPAIIEERESTTVIGPRSRGSAWTHGSTFSRSPVAGAPARSSGPTPWGSWRRSRSRTVIRRCSDLHAGHVRAGRRLRTRHPHDGDRPAASTPAAVVGMDVNPEMIRRRRQRAHPGRCRT